MFTGLREAAHLTGDEAAAALAGFNRLLRALGLTLPAEVVQDSAQIPEAVKALAEARWQARLAKNWAESDVLRGQLTEQGWTVKDGKDTYTLERTQG
jgi:cysteinyl-tRNA synthetase